MLLPAGTAERPHVAAGRAEQPQAAPSTAMVVPAGQQRSRQGQAGQAGQQKAVQSLMAKSAPPRMGGLGTGDTSGDSVAGSPALQQPLVPPTTAGLEASSPAEARLGEGPRSCLDCVHQPRVWPCRQLLS